MSAAAAAPTVDVGAVVPVKRGKKKLMIIVAVAVALVLLLAAGGGGVAFYLKKQAAHAAEATEPTAEAAAGEPHAAKPDLKHPPTFLPLDAFVVNLADKDADRYAQIGITLEVEDAKFAEQLKAFMPAIRNGILMILAHKSARELLDRAGKEQVAAEILREAARTMGIDVDEPPAGEKAGRAADDAKDKPADADEAKPEAKPKARKAPAEPNPIRRVHFSNFIVQ